MEPTRIIDAHLHIFRRDAWADRLARRMGHENTPEHLWEQMEKLHIVHGVVMGNEDPTPEAYTFSSRFSYCVGLSGAQIERLGPGRMPAMVEEHLRKPQCCGIKLYPGYDSHYVSDPIYEPYYELAARYGKPVAIHTGQTQGSKACLKYCHPLTLDDVAVSHPQVQFVMCHFGNPFLPDAAAVLEKNENLVADLSGLLAGYEDLDSYFIGKHEYIDMLRGWLSYGDYWDRILFGTDWPGVNLPNSLGFIDRLLPDKCMQPVLFDNANRIYQLGL